MSGDGSGVYTPPSRRGGGNGGDVKVVVQQVKEAGVALRYPILAEDNFDAWVVKIKIFMRAQGLWAAVEGRQAVVDRLDQMALVRDDGRGRARDGKEGVGRSQGDARR
jgi:hypothetical protein